MLQGLAATLHQHAELAPVIMTVLALVVGLSAQVLASRLKVPSIIFLLVGGLLLGPSGLGLVQPHVYGTGLRAVVALCVAIIVFEGALLIDVPVLRTSASKAVLGLVSVGVAVTTTCAAAAAHALVGLDWPVAWLFGALVSVTGPTVISPILARLSLAPHLRTTLEGESVLADAVGVMVASTIFTVTTNPQVALAPLLGGFALAGLLGGALAFASFFALKALAPLPGTLVRLWVLATALAAYVGAELVAHDAGIMAVAVAGIVLGSLPLPYPESIKQFKGDLTVLALSLVFILLAANLPLGRVFALGWPAVGLAALLMLVVRPVCVAVATLGSDLSWREKAFLAALAPRGIVAVSAATFFSLELQAQHVPGADGLAGLVFVVVVATVVIEGGLAPRVARWLGVVPPRVLILGGDKQARQLAEHLQEQGEMVQLLDDDLDNVHALLSRELPAELCPLDDHEALRRLGAAEAKTLVIATDDDERNLALAQQVRAAFPEASLYVRLNGEADREALDALGVSLWPAAGDRPGPLPLSVWNAAVQPEVALEVPVHNVRLTAAPLAELELPAGMVVAMVKRAGRTFVPDGGTRLRFADAVVLLGDAVAVNRARVLFEPPAATPRWPRFGRSPRTAWD